MDFYNFNEDDLSKLSKIQSHFRKKYVQCEMKKLRNCYESIFYEIEGNDTDTQISWHNEDSICAPKFLSKKASSKPLSNRSNKSAASENNSLKLNSTEITPNETRTISNEPVPKLNLAEIQMNGPLPVIDISDADAADIKKILESNNHNQTVTINSAKRSPSTASNLGIEADQLDYFKVDNLKKLNPQELEAARENISFELLWIQQAIESRVNYLKLKKNMERSKENNRK